MTTTTFRWLIETKPSRKPITPTQKALLEAVAASNTTVFDASKWNIRTVVGLWCAGLIYVSCGPKYKQIALTCTGKAKCTAPCACCDREWPTDALKPIESDDVYALLVRDYSMERDGLCCPECHDAISREYVVEDNDVYSVYDAGRDPND